MEAQKRTSAPSWSSSDRKGSSGREQRGRAAQRPSMSTTLKAFRAAPYYSINKDRGPRMASQTDTLLFPATANDLSALVYDHDCTSGQSGTPAAVAGLQPFELPYTSTLKEHYSDNATEQQLAQLTGAGPWDTRASELGNNNAHGEIFSPALTRKPHLVGGMLPQSMRPRHGYNPTLGAHQSRNETPAEAYQRVCDLLEKRSKQRSELMSADVVRSWKETFSSDDIKNDGLAAIYGARVPIELHRVLGCNSTGSTSPIRAKDSTPHAIMKWQPGYVTKLANNHPLHGALDSIVVALLTGLYKAKTHGSGADKSSRDHYVGSTSSSSNHLTPIRPSRRVSGAGNREDEQEDDEQPPSKRRKNLHKDTDKLFACPFAVWKPLKYEKCLDKKFKRIKDVKQHLERSHQKPIYCPRCKYVFATEKERDSHAETTICQVNTERVCDGVTQEQNKVIGTRADRKISHEEQWFVIFQVLFPDYSQRPSPYAKSPESVKKLEVFSHVMRTGGRDIMKDVFEKSVYSSIPHESHHLESLFSAAVDKAIQQITENWQEPSPASIPDCTESSSQTPSTMSTRPGLTTSCPTTSDQTTSHAGPDMDTLGFRGSSLIRNSEPAAASWDALPTDPLIDSPKFFHDNFFSMGNNSWLDDQGDEQDQDYAAHTTNDIAFGAGERG